MELRETKSSRKDTFLLENLSDYISSVLKKVYESSYQVKSNFGSFEGRYNSRSYFRMKNYEKGYERIYSIQIKVRKSHRHTKKSQNQRRLFNKNKMRLSQQS